MVDCWNSRNVRIDSLPFSVQSQLIIVATSTVTVGFVMCSVFLTSSCAMFSRYYEIAGILAMCILIYRQGHGACGQCMIGVDYSGQGFMVSAASV